MSFLLLKLFYSCHLPYICGIFILSVHGKQAGVEFYKRHSTYEETGSFDVCVSPDGSVSSYHAVTIELHHNNRDSGI